VSTPVEIWTVSAGERCSVFIRRRQLESQLRLLDNKIGPIHDVARSLALGSPWGPESRESTIGGPSTSGGVIVQIASLAIQA
jgi:hypothetical protein